MQKLRFDDKFCKFWQANVVVEAKSFGLPKLFWQENVVVEAKSFGLPKQFWKADVVVEANSFGFWNNFEECVGMEI